MSMRVPEEDLSIHDCSITATVEGWCLNIVVCGRPHHDPTCGFLLFWFQITIELFTLFRYCLR